MSASGSNVTWATCLLLCAGIACSRGGAGARQTDAGAGPPGSDAGALAREGGGAEEQDFADAAWSSVPERMLAQQPGTPLAVASDGENIYWTQVSGQLFAVAKLGGAPRLLTPTAQKDVLYTLVQDSDNLYYVRVRGIYRLAKTGGDPVAVLEEIAGKAGTTPTFRNQVLASDDAYLYFAQLVPSEGVAIGRVRKDGSDRQILASKLLNVQALAVDDQFLFWTDEEDADGNPDTLDLLCFVKKMPKAGGATTTVADRGGYFQFSSLLTMRDRVIWADAGSNGKLASAAKEGGDVHILATSPRGVGRSLAADGDNVLWPEGYSLGLGGVQYGYLVSTPLSGGKPTRVTQTLRDIRGIAVDPTAVYYGEGLSSSGGGRLWVVPRTPGL